ncbi:MAG: cation transporter [Deltaproteobacteria bacterium]|nr:cation transporter [Deltaproteobacteria bacterium]
MAHDTHQIAEHPGGHRGEHRHHGHSHGVTNASYIGSERGLWALKYSFAILAAGALMQLAVVMLSGSVALLADMIHNAADAATAIPLAIAFIAVRRPPSERFTYGYGRLEDFAGLAIVLIILGSTFVIGFKSIERLMAPRPIAMPSAVAAAGLIGFAANEAIALLRIRVGREINSIALEADGYHARADGLASLAVAAGAIAVRFGLPMADPLVGLAIGALVAMIALQAAGAVLVRMLDGVESRIIVEIQHAAGHVEGIDDVANVRARWLGHQLEAEAEIAVDPATSLREATAIADRFRHAAAEHLPAAFNMRVVITAREPVR